MVNSSGNDSVRLVVAYRKRYATKNISATVAVNGGNNIAVNSRYEVGLPSEFYEADGSIKKGVNVRAEIFNNSGTGVADWGNSGHYNETNYSALVRAEILGNKVIVQTGDNRIAHISLLSIIHSES